MEVTNPPVPTSTLNLDDLPGFNDKDRRKGQGYVTIKKKVIMNDTNKETAHISSVWDFIRYQRVKLGRRMNEIQAEANNCTALEFIKMLTDEEMTMVREGIENHILPNGEHGAIDRGSFVALMSFVFCHHRGIRECPPRLSDQLNDLFIGINSTASGTVNWEDFSTYMLEAMSAMGAHADIIPQYQPKYVRSRPATFHGKTFVSTCFSYLPHVDKILAMEGAATTTQVAILSTSTFKEVTSFTIPHVVTTGEYLPDLQALIFGISSGSLLTYTQRRNLTQTTILSTPFTLENKAHVVSPPLKLTYVAGSGLWASTRQGHLINYEVSADAYFYDEKANIGVHTEPITDFLILPRLHRVISSCMYGGLKVSSLVEGRSILEISAAKNASVLTLAYQEDTNVLLTTGCDQEPKLWMLLDSKNQLIGKLFDGLVPHKHRIVGGFMANFATDFSQASGHLCTTVDEGGMVKLWDMRKMCCVQTTNLEPTLTKQQRTSYHVTNVLQRQSEIICTATSLTRQTNMYSVKAETSGITGTAVMAPKDIVLTAALYNFHTQSIAVVIGQSVTTFDAKTGKVALHVPNVSPSGVITAATLDDKGRRLIVGTYEGHVRISSASTGSKIYDRAPHRGEVTSIVYCSGPRYIVTTSSDRICHVYGEGEDPAVLFVIRTQNRLMMVAHSTPLCLFALCDACEEMKVYDLHNFLELHLQSRVVTTKCKAALGFRREVASQFNESINPTDVAVHEYVTPPVCEIVCATFLEPYPAVVFGDSGAILSVAGIRPYPFCSEPLCMWRSSPARSAETNIVNVTTSMVFHAESCSLLTADDQGCVVTWNMHDVIFHMSLVPATFPPEEGTTAHYSSLKGAPPMYSRSPSKLKSWRVCKACITQMTQISPKTLLLGCNDGVLIIIERLTGKKLAVFSSEGSISPEMQSVPYTFVPPPMLSYEESAQTVSEETSLSTPRGLKIRASHHWAQVRSKMVDGGKYKFSSIVVNALKAQQMLKFMTEVSVTPPGSPPYARTPHGSPSHVVEMRARHILQDQYGPPGYKVLSDVATTRLVQSTVNTVKDRDTTKARYGEHIHDKIDEVPREVEIFDEDRNTQRILEGAATKLQDLVATVQTNNEEEFVFLRKRLRALGIPQHLRALLYEPGFVLSVDAPPWVQRVVENFRVETFTTQKGDGCVSAKPTMRSVDADNASNPEYLFIPQKMVVEDWWKVRESEFMINARRHAIYGPLMHQPITMSLPPESPKAKSKEKVIVNNRAGVPLDQLLHLSSPSYPVTASPYLDLQRSAPAFSPLVFMNTSRTALMDASTDSLPEGPTPATPQRRAPPKEHKIRHYYRSPRPHYPATLYRRPPDETTHAAIQGRSFTPFPATPEPVATTVGYIPPPCSLLNPAIFGLEDAQRTKHHNIPQVRAGSANPTTRDVRRHNRTLGVPLEPRRLTEPEVQKVVPPLSSHSLLSPSPSLMQDGPVKGQGSGVGRGAGKLLHTAGIRNRGSASAGNDSTLVIPTATGCRLHVKLRDVTKLKNKLKTVTHIRTLRPKSACEKPRDSPEPDDVVTTTTTEERQRIRTMLRPDALELDVSMERTKITVQKTETKKRM